MLYYIYLDILENDIDMIKEYIRYVRNYYKKRRQRKNKQKKKIKQMRRLINKYGVITVEYKRPKDEFYRKGSYFANFNSDILDCNSCIGHIDKYNVYKSIVRDIKEYIKGEMRE